MHTRTENVFKEPIYKIELKYKDCILLLLMCSIMRKTLISGSSQPMSSIFKFSMICSEVLITEIISIIDMEMSKALGNKIEPTESENSIQVTMKFNLWSILIGTCLLTEEIGGALEIASGILGLIPTEQLNRICDIIDNGIKTKSQSTEPH